MTKQDRACTLYRVKWIKRITPAARFVYGSPQLLFNNAGSLMRMLLRRGIPLALIDAPVGVPSSVGRIFHHKDVRYYRGAVMPEPGDLLNTEILSFGP